MCGCVMVAWVVVGYSPRSCFAWGQGMRGLSSLRRIAASSSRASSRSSTRFFGRASSAAISRIVGSFDCCTSSPIGVFPLLHSIVLDVSAVETKEDSVGSDSQPVVAPLTFQLFHIPGQILLKQLQLAADVATNVFGKFAELLSCFLGDGEVVLHREEPRVYQRLRPLAPMSVRDCMPSKEILASSR